MKTASSPMAIAVKNPRFLSNFPVGLDQLWQADVKLCRHKTQCEVFEGVLFVESSGTAFIYGIEFEDGYPAGFQPELARKQQAFIAFLRTENSRDNDALGLAAFLFSGHEYRHQARATAGYIAARGLPMSMGVGYFNRAGGYERETIDTADDGWLESARATLPFDKLGV